MSSTTHLRQERAKLISDARKILTVAETETRSLNTEEHAAWQKLHTRAEELRGTYEAIEKQASAESDLTTPEQRSVPPHQTRGRASPRTTPEYRAAYKEYLKGAPLHEIRGFVTNVSTKGGSLVAPQEMIDTVIEAVDNAVVISEMATVYDLSEAVSLGVPSRESDIDDAEWTTEIAESPITDVSPFGRRELAPHRITKTLKVSRKFLRSAVIDVEEYVGNRLGYKLGVPAEKSFMAGTGVGQPLGLFTPTSLGISTARDVDVGANLASITGNALISCKYALKPQYMASKNTSWLFNRAVVEAIAKLKDSNGQYLWMPSLREGQPDTLLAIPIVMSEYAPTTTYCGMIGDFSNYWIARVADVEITRLDEAYFRTSEVGFQAEWYVDGAPVLEEAFVRLKLA